MTRRKITCGLWLLAVAGGAAALIFAFIWGFNGGQGPRSLLWLAATALALCVWFTLAVVGGTACLRGRRIFPLNLIFSWLRSRDGGPLGFAFLFTITLACFEFFLLSFMFLPPYIRWFAAWGLGLGILGFLLRWIHFTSIQVPQAWEFPSLSRLDRRQKKVLWVLLGIIAINFFLLIPRNLHGTQDAGRFLATGEDEVVIYPILTTLFKPSDDLRLGLYRVIEYDDYHYGYPFYVVSALAVLPSRIIFGPDFETRYWLNLLLLRQLVSVLPMLLAALLLVYLATRFRSLPASILALVLILTIPAVVRYEQVFWHPDALAVLFVVLTFYFLDRDKLRFRSDFYLAALFCGLASAVRLVGFFFFLSIACYLMVGWLRGRGFARTLGAGSGFVLVMAATILLSNPFLFDAGARTRMLATMAEKSQEMAFGYESPDPHQIYQTGWVTWQPFLERDYGSRWYLAVLLLTSVCAALFGQNRVFPAVLLGWAFVMGGYLIFFVAAKSFQYGLPVFVPLYGSALLLLDIVRRIQLPRLQNFGVAFVYLAGIAQCVSNIVILTSTYRLH